MAAFDSELFFLFLTIVAPAVLTSMVVGHKGGYAGHGMIVTCGRAWATTTKWAVLLAIGTVGLLLAIGLLCGWNVEILGHYLPFLSMVLLVLVALYFPITGITAFLFHYFGARKRARDSFSASPQPPEPQ